MLQAASSLGRVDSELLCPDRINGEEGWGLQIETNQPWVDGNYRLARHGLTKALEEETVHVC